MSHAAQATANLFSIVSRFQAGCPLAIRPPLSHHSASALTFAGLESSYRVGTAKTGAVGRSDTIQLFHGSEAAFWPRAAEHVSGALQAVPTEPGTEIWLESTVPGPGSFFHDACIRAIKGLTPFRFLCVPWFLNEAYRVAGDGFDPAPRDEEENDLVVRSGLGADQLAWRRAKLAEIGPEAFRHEYPASPEDALAVDHPAVAIDRRLVRAAVCREVIGSSSDLSAPVVWGLDPGRFAGDRSVLAKRRGDVLLEPGTAIAGPPPDPRLTVSATIAAYAGCDPAFRPETLFVAAIGPGRDIAHALRCAGLPAVDVDGGGLSVNDGRFPRRRDALWWAAREWLMRRRCRIPDDPALILDLSAPLRRVTSSGQLEIEPAHETRERLGFSPDTAEALSLTFAGTARSVN